MNTNDVQLFLTEARLCAFVMFESSISIQHDLADFQLPDILHAEAIQICSALIKTKDELHPELADFEKLLTSVAIDESSWLDAINLILKWLWGNVPQLENVIKSLENSTEYQPQCQRAALIVARSTDKIVEAFNRSLTAAKRITDERLLRWN